MYFQDRGTAMGACFTPNYASLFLGLWEKEVVHTRYNDKIKWWGRYIDDILLFGTGSEEEFLLFYDFLNTNNRNIKLHRIFSKQH